MVIDYLVMDLFSRWPQEQRPKRWWWFLTVMILFLVEKHLECLGIFLCFISDFFLT